MASTSASTSHNHQSVDFSAVIAALNQASGFELFRLRAAIDRTLDQPQWINAIRKRLHPGQNIQFFSLNSNSTKRAKIVELRRKQVLVHDESTQQHWLIPYPAVNLEGIDVHIRETPKQGLGHNEVRVTDRVGFVDNHGQEHSGQIIRINHKTVTVVCDHRHWRVPYSLLHRVVES